jgi:hypothetical protein
MTLAGSSSVQAWLVQHDPLRIIPWRDPVVEAVGHDPRSQYVENYWLAILGPSATLAARRLVTGLDESPAGFTVPLAPFAAQLGLGDRTGLHSPVVRTLGRLAVFGMASTWGDAYAVRLAFPPLARRHLRRLPEHLAETHRLETESVSCAGESRTATAAPRW